MTDRRNETAHRKGEQAGKTLYKLWLLLGVRWELLVTFKQRNNVVLHRKDPVQNDVCT